MSPPLPSRSSLGLALLALSCAEAKSDAETGQTPHSTVNSEPASEAGVPRQDAGAAATAAVPTSSAAPNPTSAAASSAVGSTPATASGGNAPPPVNDCASNGVQGDSVARAMLAPYTVRHDDVARRLLFSWTTAEQIEELRATPRLLTRAMDSMGERGRAADLILQHAANDPLAELLARPEFENKRFAWTNAWATLLGWDGETYGDRLLAITLRPEAWVGRLEALIDQTLVWAFFDLDGNEVPAQTVLATPERLAAVYFIDARDPALCQGSLYVEGAVLREYFVCNEGMIERWEAFTPTIQQELESAVSALDQMHGALLAEGCESPQEDPVCWRARVVQQWLEPESTPAQDAALAQLYENSLALPNDLYMPSASNLDNLLERLRQVPLEPEPLEHTYPLNAGADSGSPR